MKIGGSSYGGAERIMPEPPCKEQVPQSTPPMDGGDYSSGGGHQPTPPDFPTSKPPMGGTNWGNG